MDYNTVCKKHVCSYLRNLYHNAFIVLAAKVIIKLSLSYFCKFMYFTDSSPTANFDAISSVNTPNVIFVLKMAVIFCRAIPMILDSAIQVLIFYIVIIHIREKI